MITAKIKTDINFPKLKLQSDLKHIANKIFIPIISEGIDKGIDISGKRFPKLSKRTIEIKRRRGQRLEPLMATGKLRRSPFSKSKGKNSIVISLKSDRKEIGEKLQIKGVGKSKKKFEFFGISKKMENLAVAHIRNKINKAINNAK